MKVEIMKERGRNESGADAVIVKAGEQHYLVSSVVAMFTGFETLVFECDEKGEVTNWGEIAGGREVTRAKAIADLEATLTD